MFSLQVLSSHEKVLGDLAAGWQSQGEISGVWSSTPHFFVALSSGQGRTLQVFNSSPSPTTPTKKEQQINEDAKNYFSYVSPLVQLCFLKSDPSIVYGVFDNGLVNQWCYNEVDCSWSQRRQYNLCNTQGPQITAVHLDESQGVIFWCEKRTLASSGPVFCICKRSFSKEAELLGPVVALLHNCPACDFYQVADKTCIWPRGPAAPANLFFVWEEPSGILKSGVLTEDGLQSSSSEVFVKGLDFKKVALRAAGLWTKVPERQIAIIKLPYPSKRQLLTILNNGDVYTINEEEFNAIFICKLCLNEGEEEFLKEASEWFLFYFAIGALVNSKKIIRFFSPETGDILYDLSFHDLTIQSLTPTKCHTWYHFGCDYGCGLYCGNRIWNIQLCEADQMSGHLLDHPAVGPRLLQKLYGSARQRPLVHMCLEEAHRYYQSRTVRGADVSPPSLLMGRGPLEKGPAIMINLMKKHQEKMEGGMEPALSGLYGLYSLCDSLENGPVLAQLSQQLRPQMEQFWALHQLCQDIADSPQGLDEECAGNFQAIVQEEILHLLQDSQEPGDKKQKKLDELMKQFPNESLLALTNFFIQAESGREALADCLQGSPNAPPALLESVCTLFFIEAPEKLVNFVEICQIVLENSSQTTVYQKVDVISQCLKCLPECSQSKNRQAAVKAKAKVLSKSEDTQQRLFALESLIQEELFSDALVLLSQCADNSSTHRQMFNTLSEAILQRKEMMLNYSDQLWDLMPAQMSALDLVDLLKQHALPTSGQCANSEVVFSASDQGCQLKAVKTRLIKMLSPP